MGLLTNESSRNKLVVFLQKYDLKLSILMYIVGLVWFLALAYQPLNAGTYFSENALLPGLVESELPQVLNSLSSYKDQVKAEQNKDKKQTIQAWIFNQFQDLGLDTYKQNFSVVYPFTSLKQKPVEGQNVYSILRARRAASTEALVLSVPLRPVASKQKGATGGGIALTLALAKELKQKPYWAKDIIFLFTDYDEIGPLAWLDAYHQTSSQFLNSQDLPGRSGPIQGALNIELPLEKVSYYAVKVEGLNGQLANLDLVNLVVKLVGRERARISIHEAKEERKTSLYYDPNGESLQEYLIALKTMMRMMWYQASGAPSGNHGMFHRYHIEAVTLKGVKEKKGSNRHDLNTSARMIEGILRSLNNLLERFHQSFFFYILPGTNRYVSIGMYMPPFGLMAAAGLIKRISLWFGADVTSTSTSDKKDNSKDGNDAKKSEEEKEKVEKKEKEENEDENKSEETSPELEGDTETDKDTMRDKSKMDEMESLLKDELFSEEDSTPSVGILSLIPIIFVSLLLGFLAYQGPELLTRIMPRFRIHTEDMVLYSILAIFTAAIMYPKLMIRKTTRPELVFDWRLLKSLALISQTLALACISISNISQAFFLTVFLVPVTLFVRPSASRLLTYFQMLLLVLVCPLTLLFCAGLVSAWPTEPTVVDWLVQGYSNTKDLIFLAIVDNYIFNAWSHATVSAIFFPIWLLFWALPWAKV